MLEKELVLAMLLQQRLFTVLHGEQYLTCIFVACFLETLLLMIVLLPIISRRFLHLRNAIMGGSENSSLNFGFMFKIFHLSHNILPICGIVQL